MITIYRNGQPYELVTLEDFNEADYFAALTEGD